MADDLKDFVVGTAKKCDECGYCTQTDKTGKRKRLAIEVSHHDVSSICPLYPGFSFTFTELGERLTTNLMAFLDFMDRHISGR
ncbi:MAG: hypothetical protein MUQ10_09665 [Anaerolineae bacterium]|nr:hypothetical protein [Anaerolineae bacterium]